VLTALLDVPAKPSWLRGAYSASQGFDAGQLFGAGIVKKRGLYSSASL
jgi:hypothetical protein